MPPHSATTPLRPHASRSGALQRRSPNHPSNGTSKTTDSAGIIERLAELGVFGPPSRRNSAALGLGKLAMCVVTEELSRGCSRRGLAWHPLGNRRRADPGRAAPRRRSALAAKDRVGAILPTAVFTEPDTGSDLGALKTRAVRDGDATGSPATRPGSPMPRAPI